VLILDEPLPPPFSELFRPTTARELSKWFRLTCIACGACCEYRAGCWGFRHEIDRILREFPSIEVECVEKELIDGSRVEICAIGGEGPCPLYDPHTHRCRVHSTKPAICRVFYCTLFAEKNGELLIKTRLGGETTYVPTRRPVNELRKAARNFIRKLAEKI